MARIQKRTRIIRPLGSSSNSEVVTARDSATYGAFASLDARLEAFEILVATASHAEPTLTGNLANVLNINASIVFSFDTQLQNLALLSPIGSTGEPSFRAIAAADLPSNVVYDAITLTAGAGLTGGGDLSASRTFNVGAGNGIIVNANTIEIDTAIVAEVTDLHTILTLGADTAPVFSIGAGQILTFDSQLQNLFLASPSGSSGDPTMRAMVESDLPSTVQTGTDSELATLSNNSIFKGMPGMRLYYPISHVHDTGEIPDIISSQHVANTGNAQFNYSGLLDFVALNGTTQYFTVADAVALDILGTEAYVAAGVRGATFGGWFYFDNAASSAEFCFSKWGAVGQRSWNINRQSSGIIRASIFDTGASQDLVDSTRTVGAGVWRFLCLSYDPSTSLNIYVASPSDTSVTDVGVRVTNNIGIGSSILNSTAPLNIGGANNGSNLMDGRFRDPFAAVMFWDDTLVDFVFNHTKGKFL